MKSWIIAIGTFGAFIIIGTLVSVFTAPTEYHYAEADSYLAGATPSQFEHWEMY
jgi:hypothetical protein